MDFQKDGYPFKKHPLAKLSLFYSQSTETLFENYSHLR